MSSMKGGFSTLNRWFGKNKKDKNGVAGAAANGKLSKSTTQLHHLSTDSGMLINETSQLEYNRITPLPAATSNAPFEQTFRITVLLPKDQLYVARLGARVPLSKLLSLVCDNKQLDAAKYEFRSPVDPSQVYSCESTIGAVGLSEIRLCHKSEPYDNFNADAMLKFQRTGAVRDSLSSSSDFSSSRHSKLTTKTPSPYSSSNSLNSMDSTGMNYTRTPVVPPKALAPPPRKKRVAPRPPSQVVIPEQSVMPDPVPGSQPTEPAYAVIVKRPQLCVSTPNLSTTLELDCNGNSAKTPDASSYENDGHYATLEVKRNSSSGLPEPTPRKRIVPVKKKAAAPAPPPEGAAPSADTISLASTTASTVSELQSPQTPMSPQSPEPPQPAPRINTPLPLAQAMTNPLPTPPPPLPNSAAPVLVSTPPIPNNNNNGSNNNSNVSKVLLNRTPTPEPRSLGSNTMDEDNDFTDDTASKQADSGIGEPVPSPSPLPDSLASTSEADGEAEAIKSNFESSSDDDEAIKVYNFKLCKTSVKEEPHPTTLAELTLLTASGAGAEDDNCSLSGQSTPAVTVYPTPNASEHTSLSSWNYSVPISPPPDFSDTQKERPVQLVEERVEEKKAEVKVQEPTQQRIPERPQELGPLAINRISSPAAMTPSPLDEIVDELSTIIQEQRLDTLIRKQATSPEIEAAKPNKLANFSIAAISTSSSSSTTVSTSTMRRETHSLTISRADSFQASSGGAVSESSQNGGGGLGVRSSSHLSLTKIEQNGLGLNQRRSSSELSIGESPSLQSLEVIKTILGSRKNSLAESNNSSKPTSPQPQESQLSQEPSKPKSSPTPASPPAAAAEIPQKAAAPVEEAVVQTRVQIEEISPQPVTPKPLPPTYRYSGPPSINFATWSERPKSQVAIKNEGDYIFGGKLATQQSVPSAEAPVTPVSPKPVTAQPTKLTIEAAAPILRMGIPRKEYKVPITVKPLRDVSVENQSLTVEPPTEQSQSQLQSQSQSQSSTLPRPAKTNRYTLPANLQQTGLSVSSTNSLPRNSSSNAASTATTTSTTNLIQSTTQSRTEETVVAAAPFGQNTLRRTGFKERMLAKEQQEKEHALRVRVSVNGSAAVTATQVTTPVTPSAQVIAVVKPQLPAKTALIQSNKVELKLKQSNYASPPATPATAESQSPLPATKQAPPAVLQVKLRPTSLATTAPTPPPPAPPLAPVLLKSTSKPRSVGTVTPTSPDPRSQLLEAIRNFRKEELNRA